jgi:hypothetical protein
MTLTLPPTGHPARRDLVWLGKGSSCDLKRCDGWLVDLVPLLSQVFQPVLSTLADIKMGLPEKVYLFHPFLFQVSSSTKFITYSSSQCFSRCFHCFFTELHKLFLRWVRTGIHAVPNVSEPTVGLKLFLQ